MAYDLEIEEHEVAIAALKVRQAAEHDGETKKRLVEIRTKLRLARTEHAKLTARIPIEDEARLNAQKYVLNVIEALGDHQRKRPPSADFLDPAEDEEVRIWTERHDELVRLREAATAKIPAPPPHFRQAELALEIQQLQHAEHACIEKLRGGLGAFPSGGVFGVS